jgi:hypothetical protein
LAIPLLLFVQELINPALQLLHLSLVGVLLGDGARKEAAGVKQ